MGWNDNKDRGGHQSLIPGHELWWVKESKQESEEVFMKKRSLLVKTRIWRKH